MMLENTISKLRNMKFFIFLSSYNQLVILDVIVFPLATFVLLSDLSRKSA